MTFKTKATALITATTIALGAVAATATPAAALGKKDRDALKVLLGIGAAALILDSVNNSNRQRAQPAPRHYTNETWQQRQTRLERERRERERREARDRRERHDRDRISLPQQCVQQVRTRTGWSEVVSADCLDRHTRARLPDRCSFDMKTGRNRYEEVYGRNCLEDRGVRFSRR
ncbi:hypothetical protein [Thioclava atlantica]|uniref:Uncharacterized protein n=1 Tax=Thioclava atlantica TaxID=1317124 RepID=A0A085TWJ8_9RHOB|nr:hypothetical protein [Thioclava atlantica]KFE35095.1 hypothetical protein DW2_08976 [Thioclava atlantica]